jgi:hypothetical protein
VDEADAARAAAAMRHIADELPPAFKMLARV